MSILALLVAMQTAPASDRTPCRGDTNLVGTWRVVEARGQQWPDDHPVHKHVTPTHFTVVRWDPAKASMVFGAHGGTQAVGDATYTETVLYGFGPGYEKMTLPFRMQARCWTSGNEWHIEAEMPGVDPLREVWVRVSPR